MRWLTPEEEEMLRIDFRNNDLEIQKSFWAYFAAAAVLLVLFVTSRFTSLLAVVTGNGGYNAFAFLAFALFNVMYTCYMLYRSLNIHETMQLLILFSPPDSGMLNWEAWRRSSQSATRPVRGFYHAILLGLPLLASLVILGGVLHLLWATHALDALRVPMWTAWWLVVGLHALPFWFGYHCMGPTTRRWEGIATLRGVEPSRFHVPAPAEMAGWPVDVQPLPDGTVLIANQVAVDLALLSRRELLSHYHQGRFTLTRDTLRLIERLGARPPLLHGLRTALGDAERVELRFARA